MSKISPVINFIFHKYVHQVFLFILFLCFCINFKLFIIIPIYITSFFLFQNSYLHSKIKLVFFKLFKFFILYFPLFLLLACISYIFYYFYSVVNKEDILYFWTKMTYQDFGFSKRLLIPSFFKLFSIELSNYLYKTTIIFILIFLLFYFFYSHYQIILKNHNFYILFFIFYIFFISPVSTYRFFNSYIINDGVHIISFLISFLLILKFSSTLIYILISFISVISILNHETYIAFFVPILFVIAKFQKASLLKLLIFSIPTLITGFYLFLFGRLEQFSSIEEFQKAAFFLKDNLLFSKNESLCNFYNMMPYMATFEQNIQFTKCIFLNHHLSSTSFYLTLFFLVLFILLFIDFILRNNLPKFWSFIGFIPSFLIFLIACDIGRWSTFICLMMTSIMFYFSIHRKLTINRKITLLLFSMFILGETTQEFYNLTYYKDFYLWHEYVVDEKIFEKALNSILLRLILL